jgi:tRNA/rRNA methyltransferase
MEFCFILVEPAVPGNVGASARAMKTMGFRQLRLIQPCNYLDEEAVKMAHGSLDVLQKAKVYKSLNEAIEDLDLVIGTTAKKRSVREDYHKSSDLPEIIRDKGASIHSVGIVFGREESGLTNSELKICDLVTRIPMIADYPSLNLSQAVMVYGYILSEFILSQGTIKENSRNEKGLRELIRKTDTILTNLSIKENPTLYHRILERLVLLAEDDIHILHSIANKFQEKFGE